MDRLTDTTTLNGSDWINVPKRCKVCWDKCESCNADQECIDRLAEYENTGLSPAEITALKAENERLKEENSKLRRGSQRMKEKTIYDYYPLNLMRDVLDKDVLDMVYIRGISTALGLLSERERQMLSARYERGLTLEQLGKEQGVTRERIRQIIAKAIRKLRNPSYSRKFLGMSIVEHYQILAEKERSMIEKEQAIHAYYVAHTDSKPPKKSIELQSIEYLDLSVRSYNCLIRAGKKTIGDVAETSYEKLIQIRNLGRRSLQEIVTPDA